MAYTNIDIQISLQLKSVKFKGC